MDRNQATGLILISIMLLLYFSFFGGKPEVPPTEEATTEQVQADTTNIQPQINQSPTISTDIEAPAGLEAPIEQPDTLTTTSQVEEKTFNVENNDLILTFSSKGGRITQVELKDYVTYNKEPLILLDKTSSSTSLKANNAGQQIDLFKLPYEFKTTQKNDTTTVTFTLTNSKGGSFRQIYKIPPSGYLIDYDIRANNMDYLLASDLSYDWKNNLKNLEKDPVTSRIKTSIKYYTLSGDFDDLSERSNDLKTAEVGALKWMTFKQLFFTTGFIAKNRFSRMYAEQEGKVEDSTVDKYTNVSLGIPADDIRLGKSDFQFFFGPNSYPLLKKVAPDFEKNIYLGWPPVNLVNKWIIIPIFNWLKQFISNFGIVIIILVLIIKLALSPLSYTSYLSMAKMKVMKPELDELKEKVGGDQQKFQQEQMKLYQQVGVNPLSGCIPMVLQMPILFAMFYFFPSSIELRQQPFLWADDLSTYDSVMHLPFHIPLYGDHVSLFVLLMTLSTILYTWSNNQMTTVQGPMKSLGYMMPVIFMFVLNSFPAALSFYYFVANIITFAQQALIRKFVNEDKIKSILEENRLKNKDKKKSKFQQRLDQAMKASEKAKKGKK